MCFDHGLHSAAEQLLLLTPSVTFKFDSKCTLTETKIAEFANSVDLDEMAHNEPPHLDLHCLPSSL